MAGAIFDADESIDPDSPNYNGSAGWVDGSGEDFSTGVYFMCTDMDNNFQIGCDSDHPDKVNISTKQGKVDQRRNDNGAYAWMWVDRMGGIDEGETEFELDCERVQLKGKSNDDTEKIESQCTLKKCIIPGGLTVDQYRSAEGCIDDAEETEDIGKNVTTLKLDNNNQLGGKIKSKGLWD